MDVVYSEYKLHDLYWFVKGFLIKLMVFSLACKSPNVLRLGHLQTEAGT